MIKSKIKIYQYGVVREGFLEDTDFVDWIISPATQEKIGTFGKDKWGQALFFPNSRLYTAAQPK